MAIEINVPDIGADEVEVTEILVSVGDKVEEEQSLITVEGDKASMEVPASQAGIVKEIKVAEGDKVSTGSLIMIFEAEGAADAAPAPAAEAAPAAAPAPAAAAELKEVHVPDIGGDEVEVTEIMVAVGDSIEEEQSLLTVEGDKASMEVPAPFAGTLKEIKVAAGDKVSTGSLIMVFETAGSGAPAAPAAAEAPAAAAPAASAAKEVNVPDIGGDEVEVTEIMVAVGDTVEEEQSLITVEGDKASMEVPAPFAGTVKEIKIAAGDKVSTGSLIMVFEVAGAAPAPAAAPAQAAAPAAPAPKAEAPAAAAPAATGDFKENDEYAHASPVVRRLAREFGVNLSKVKGSGRKSRILKEDVQAYVKDALKRLESGAGAAASGKGDGAALGLLPWPKVDFSKFGETEVQPLSRIKKISGANLHRNWVMIPHVTQWDNADITALEAFRKEQNAIEAKKDTGMKITPLVFIMKAVAKALEAFPAFNSSLSEDGESLILKKYVNVGIAVDTPNGLVVPVFKDVNKKGIYELSEELMAVSKKARAGKLTAADMQGGCFTISSLGGIGGTAFTPIVNAPEVGILGVSKSEMKPVWNGKEFEPRLQLPLSLSYDHRVIDGAEGARFITYLNSCLSDIRRLVL
ncbi:pyruvate dehydrogenase complex dihydrolipoyllysine-residue acetyltransferase [Vibrio alginolyticus]|jgi:pyruvate dehydrogenase E2 component (dihydrolipoamide acetyltransferase)|uniref:Acetyltransferase component of pyruvate dehydrogenase complex n=1 Tax=Vibrio alginolyticus TaxID=663 RepID=A0A7Y0MUG2_VIBAL|nr:MULTISPECIES: pyruvate dehydrogenase complex dihydrolipoyllysine-residue acetyltransferase [Vibrio]MDW2295098.1 pyruvate dehydrogenase complex dihydrolipoyllysine-residue acetyltransferase [Vibrio sp. 1404]AVF75360.1 pyruvate dehydrogenase complex dihydrolipoyllysine-residue acetyltransferase [Vibrio alginolyticus]EGQ7903832.1 pyruvate dehydrogenase complex dihydrolipoyllysine-residue acetyltransferase [Vibrio alginolyticus]EGQ9098214.1 pyruvate dehydrogenase complex dihydrolipoyllysine-resi